MLKSAPCPDRHEPNPLFVEGERFADIVAGLLARMSAPQRHAFLAKMCDLDRRHAGLSPVSATLGSA